MVPLCVGLFIGTLVCRLADHVSAKRSQWHLVDFRL